MLFHTIFYDPWFNIFDFRFDYIIGRQMSVTEVRAFYFEIVNNFFTFAEQNVVNNNIFP